MILSNLSNVHKSIKSMLKTCRMKMHIDRSLSSYRNALSLFSTSAYEFLSQLLNSVITLRVESSTAI